MDRLIQANGQPHYGIFPAAPGVINYRDFDFRSPMGRKLGALAKWRRFHQFQYFGLISDELIGGCALANLSLLGVGFVYLFHPASGRMIERQFKLPLGFGSQFSQTPDQGVCQLRFGRNLLRLENSATSREKRLLVELERVGRRTENIPPLSFLLAGALRWISPRFHPVTEGDTQQALDYLARSPAAKAATLQ